MILSQAPSTLRKPPWKDHEIGELDPSKLSATLRELALRAHRLVQAIDGSAAGVRSDVEPDPASDTQRELSEVHAQIVQLESNLQSQNLDDLAHYVAALRQSVEERLA
jgi:hypothetical protein